MFVRYSTTPERIWVKIGTETEITHKGSFYDGIRYILMGRTKGAKPLAIASSHIL